MRFPKISPWAKVVWQHIHLSLLEFLFLVFFGLMPVWLGSLFKAALGENYVAYLDSYLTGGEALLLATATIGPMLYVVVGSDFGVKKGERSFPLKAWFAFAIFAICIVSAGLYGFNEGYADQAEKLSSNIIWTVSVAVSALTIVLWFGISATNAVRETGAAAIMRLDEHDFVQDFED